MNDNGNQEREILGQEILGTKALRQKRAQRIFRLLAVFVLLPTALAALYYGAIVSPQYESVAVFTVELGSQAEAGPGKKGTAEQRDLEIARARILAHETMDVLEKKHDALGHFGGADIDWWSRLSAGAGSEKRFSYFQDHVAVRADSKFAFTLSMFAFSPESAHDLNRAVLDDVAAFFATQSEKTRADLIGAAAKEVDVATERLQAVGKSGATGVELTVAQDRLASALRGRERTEVVAAQSSRRLVVVSKPSTPTEAGRPRRLWSILTVFVTALALGGVLMLLVDFVREHAKF